MGTVSIQGNDVLVYGDVAGATVYWETTLNGATFVDADPDVQSQSLVAATRWMDSLGLTDPDTGNELMPLADDTTIPVDVINAGYELARLMIANPKIVEGFTTGGTNTKIVKAGSAMVEFFRPEDGGVLPANVLRLLAPYLTRNQGEGGGTAGGIEAFGTDVCQPFTNAKDPDLNGGFA